MSDLEQRLADELGTVTTDLRAPVLDVAGLVAAGRRERVRRRSAVAGLVAAAVAVVAVLGATGLPGGHDRAVDPAPAPAPSGADLGRPLELPWWGPDDELLRIDGATVPVPGATRVSRSQGRTFVAQGADGAQRWAEVVGGRLAPVSGVPLTGPPVVGLDGTLVRLEDYGGGEYAITEERSDGYGAGGSLPTAEELGTPSGARPSSLVAVLDGGRVVLEHLGRVVVWYDDDEHTGPEEVLGPDQGDLAGGVAPAPGGVALAGGGRVVVGDLMDGRFQPRWETEGDGSGVWSDDGRQYAEGVRVSTEAGTTTLPLDEPNLRALAWESDTEVVLAQYLEEDRAVTGLWRCSVVELRCALLDPQPAGTDALVPGGRVLLPGL